MVIAYVGTVVAQLFHHGRRFVRIGGYQTAVAERAKILAGKKAVASRIAQCSGAHAGVPPAVRLRAVLHHLEAVPPRERGRMIAAAHALLGAQVAWSNPFGDGRAYQRILDVLRARYGGA